MAEQRRIFALLSEQGTACAETAICDMHDPALRLSIEQRFLNAPGYTDRDRPRADSWNDCTANEALACTVCGWAPDRDPRSRRDDRTEVER